MAKKVNVRKVIEKNGIGKSPEGIIMVTKESLPEQFTKEKAQERQDSGYWQQRKGAGTMAEGMDLLLSHMADAIRATRDKLEGKVKESEPEVEDNEDTESIGEMNKNAEEVHKNWKVPASQNKNRVEELISKPLNERTYDEQNELFNLMVNDANYTDKSNEEYFDSEEEFENAKKNNERPDRMSKIMMLIHKGLEQED